MELPTRTLSIVETYKAEYGDRKLVPPSGTRDSRICFVGEAPGEQEVKLLQPFVGQSGELLNELLANAGILRSHCYFTNVIKERPPKNDITPFIKFDRKGVTTSIEYRAYVESLKEELSNVTSNVIVAVGNVALYALTGQYAITKWRGSVLDSTLLPGRKVIPILHPASAMRQYTNRHLIALDLKRIKKESDYAEFRLPNPRIVTRPTYEETLRLLSEMRSEPRISVDIEVISGQVDCIAFAPSSEYAVCVAFYDGNGEVFTSAQEVEIWKLIQELLENPEIEILTQNGTFDATFLFERYGILTNNIQDTMILTGLITPDFPKGLDFITSVYTDYPYYKDDGKQYYKMPTNDRTAFWRYNALDTLTVAAAFPRLLDDANTMGLLETYRSHCALIPTLMYMQARGINMDTKGMEEAAVKTEAEIVQLQEALDKLVGQPMNANSPKQVAEYFYGTLGITPYTKDHKVTTDEAALSKIAAKGHPEARLILEIRGRRKLVSTYLRCKLDSDGRLRCSFNPIGTSTGRLSSSETIFGTGTNMQNQPPVMKKLMLVDEGMVAYAPDLAGAENRIVANVGPVPAMKNAFDTGKDVHRLTASLLFNKSYEDISDEIGSSPLAGGAFSERYWGKRMNHSSNYGVGPITLSDKLEIPVADAKRLLNAYHDRYPEVRHSYQAQIMQMLRENRRVHNLFGRSRLFLDRWCDTLFQEAYAFLPQSSIADIINRRGLNFMSTSSLFEPVDVLNQIHDSIIFQIPLNLGWEFHAQVLNELNESLTQPLVWRGLTFTIPCDFVMHKRNMKEKAGFKMPITAQQLEEYYNGL